MQHLPAQLENQAIRRVFDEPTETCWFSVVDIVQGQELWAKGCQTFLL